MAEASHDLVLHDRDGYARLAEVHPLSDHAAVFQGGKRALVIWRGTAGGYDARIMAAATALFGLTPAEAAVAANLLAGRSPDAVANLTGISLGTVQTHIRNLYQKTGASSQLGFLAVLNRQR